MDILIKFIDRQIFTKTILKKKLNITLFLEKNYIGKNKHFTAVYIFIESMSKLRGGVGIKWNEGIFFIFLSL